MAATITKNITVTFNDGVDLVLEYTGDFGLPGTMANEEIEFSSNLADYSDSVPNSKYEIYEITLKPSASIRTRMITAKEEDTECTLAFTSSLPAGDPINSTYNCKVNNVGKTSGDVNNFQTGMPVSFKIIPAAAPTS